MPSARPPSAAVPPARRRARAEASLRAEGGDAKQAIRAKAGALGFDAVGFTRAELPPDVGARLGEYLADGRHGDMAWMATTAARRATPMAMWPDARSAVMLGVNYAPADSPLALLGRPERANVSVYARNADYHDVIKRRLKALARWMQETLGVEVKVFVDTAPLMEKPLAAQAGLGWQGKHTNLVSPEFGSWLFLGCVLTTLELAPDTPAPDHCGSCRNCLDVCPTAAFPAPYQLDARRCISYLTIEHKGHIPREFRAAIGNRVYGCDDCLAVCPWNKFARQTGDYAFIPRVELTRPKLADYAALDEATFRKIFAGSPIKRIGRNRFLRNILIAIGNSGEPALASAAEHLLADPAPVVRAAAIWALARLLPRERFAALAVAHAASEPDDAVRAEWSLA
jgi:epoxyqueuosine reductase